MIRYPLIIVSMEEMGRFLAQFPKATRDVGAIPMYAAFPEYKSPPQIWPTYLPEGWSFGYDYEDRSAWLDAPEEAANVPMEDRGFGA